MEKFEKEENRKILDGGRERGEKNRSMRKMDGGGGAWKGERLCAINVRKIEGE